MQRQPLDLPVESPLIVYRLEFVARQGVLSDPVISQTLIEAMSERRLL